MVVEGGVNTGSFLCSSGMRRMSKNPGLCSLKWTEDWCLASPVLYVRYVAKVVGCCLPSTLAWHVDCNGTYPELSDGEVANGDV